MASRLAVPALLQNLTDLWTLRLSSRLAGAALSASCQDLLLAGGTPQFYCAVSTSRSQSLAVGGQRHRPDLCAVPLESSKSVSGHRFPQLHGVVITSRGDPFAVGRKRQTIDQISQIP